MISIGNITAGGTGKTPVTQLVLAWAKSKDEWEVASLSRGYHSELAKAKNYFHELKSVESESAKKYGDEPTLIKNRDSEIKVFIANDKLSACQKITETLKGEKKSLFIVADDAFQHRRLRRDLDIVVIDVTEPDSNYWPIPMGRARESFSSLNRADAVILSKTNLDIKRTNEWKKRIQSSFPQLPVFSLNYELGELRSLNHGEMLPLQNVALVSGIGRPESFDFLWQQKWQKALHHFQFADHHAYTKEDVQKMESQGKDKGVEAFVTTEKDAVKLKALVDEKVNWTIAPLEVKMDVETEKRFYEFLDQRLI